MAVTHACFTRKGDLTPTQYYGVYYFYLHLKISLRLNQSDILTYMGTKIGFPP